MQQTQKISQADAYDRGFNHGWYAPTHYIDLTKEYPNDQELQAAYERGFRAGERGEK